MKQQRKNKLSFEAELDALKDELSGDNDLDGEMNNEKDEDHDDNDDEVSDGHEEMTAEEIEELKKSMRPMGIVFTKLII